MKYDDIVANAAKSINPYFYANRLGARQLAGAVGSVKPMELDDLVSKPHIRTDNAFRKKAAVKEYESYMGDQINQVQNDISLLQSEVEELNKLKSAPEILEASKNELIINKYKLSKLNERAYSEAIDSLATEQRTVDEALILMDPRNPEFAELANKSSELRKYQDNLTRVYKNYHSYGNLLPENSLKSAIQLDMVERRTGVQLTDTVSPVSAKQVG
jgi:hypothetical protein